jgi:hypothetical protein
MNRSIRMVGLCLAAQVIAACSPTAPKPSISRVTLFPDGVVIGVGQSVKIVPTVTTSPSGSAYSVQWTSSSSDVVVDSTGQATGVAIGHSSVCASVTADGTNMAMQTCADVAVANQVPGPSTQERKP